MTNLPKDYRIVTNGEKFCIEELIQYRFLWWKWEAWVFTRVERGMLDRWVVTLEYSSLRDAIQALKSIRKTREIEKAPWKPIEAKDFFV